MLAVSVSVSVSMLACWHPSIIRPRTIKTPMNNKSPIKPSTKPSTKHHQTINNPPQPEPMFFAMLSVACESGKKSHKNMDVPDCRAILARDSARGCSPDFIDSCMAIRRTGTGSRPSRSRGPSKKPTQKFANQYKAMSLRRRSEPQGHQVGASGYGAKAARHLPVRIKRARIGRAPQNARLCATRGP